MTLLPQTLRVRITAIATVVFAVVLAVAALAVLWQVDRALTDELRAQNEATIDGIEAAIARGADPATLTLPLATDGTEFMVLDAAGNTINSTLVVGPPVGIDGVEEVPGDIGVPFDIDLSIDGGTTSIVGIEDVAVISEWFDIDSFSQISRTAVTADGDPVTILALNPNNIVERDVERVRNALILVIPVVAALFAAVIWLVTGRVLRPVDAISTTAGRIRGDSLHERIEHPGTNDEIGRLVDTLNDMLDRLEASAVRERQFVSDASHELRSPLTVLLGEAELAAADPTADRLATANAAALEHGKQLDRLVDDLLQLARSGESELVHDDIDLDDIVRNEASSLLHGAGVDIDTRAVAPVRLRGDERSIARAVRNLLTNAARYGGGAIVVTSHTDGDDAVVIVDDDGPGIPTEQRAQAFSRFWRADSSRARHTGGSGLGLAITQAIAAAHGGSVRIDDSPLGGARVTLRLPRRSTAAP